MTRWSLNGFSAGFRNRLILFLFLLFIGTTAQADDRAGRDLSDMNRDGRVSGEDVALFQQKFLEVNAVQGLSFDWCGWLRDHQTDPQYRQYTLLLAYVNRYFDCESGADPNANSLAVIHPVLYPTRLALGPAGEIYMTDARVGSVYVYDSSGSLSAPVAEYKFAIKPLCIAVDMAGFLYVGNSEKASVEKYAPDGSLVSIFGLNEIRMPNDAVLDADGNLYVADSRSNVIWVYRPNGQLLRTIRTGNLEFPSAVDIDYVDDGNGGTVGELYVADREHYLVKVYDLAGNYLREFGGFPIKSGMLGTSWDWEGRFVSMADLVIGPGGNLFVLDNYMINIQELDPVSGTFVRSMGEAGTGPGQMKLPIDMLILPSGEVLVADAGNRRLVLVEVLP